MTIKFHRPVYDDNIKEGDIRTLGDTLEYYFVSHNFANYCPEEEHIQAIAKEEAEEVVKPKAKAKKAAK